MSLKKMHQDNNWKEAMTIASSKVVAVLGYTGSIEFNGWNDISKVIASSSGCNDGPNWIALFQLHDERYLFLSAGCDYTGWDCQASGIIRICRNYNDMIRYGLGDVDRKRLSLHYEKQQKDNK
jgi:hypothetical protein